MVRAIAPVDENDEILVDRLPERLTWATAKNRRQALRDQYAYDCSWCDCHPDTYKAGDITRRRGAFLQQKLLHIEESLSQSGISAQDLHRVLVLANEYVALLKVVGARDVRLSRAHVFLAKLLEVLGNHSAAQDQAVQAIVVTERAYGMQKEGISQVTIGVLERCYPHV